MVYNNAIPQPTDILAVSQPQLLGNFQEIDNGIANTGTGFNRNHISMTNGSGAGGLHFRVDFDAVTTTPAVTGFVSSLYPKTVTNAELFYVNDEAEIPITNTLLTTASGEGMMPGGLQIRCQSLTLSTNSTTFSFSTAFPVACLGVVISNTLTGNNTTVFNVITITRTTFTVFATNTNGFVPHLPCGFSYIAVGY